MTASHASVGWTSTLLGRCSYSTYSLQTPAELYSNIQDALQIQRDHAMHFVTHNNKSDLQTHSRSLAIMPS